MELEKLTALQLGEKIKQRQVSDLCRLIASWGCSRSQGLGCSPIKAVRELGSERRETVRSSILCGRWKFEGFIP